MPKKYDPLNLDNQLCFLLYVASKKIIGEYHIFLDEIELTYTQYLVMIVLWSEKTANVKTLGSRLWLDSGTLTPLLKKLENKGFVIRERDIKDERNVNVSLTERGENLKKAALKIPNQIFCKLNLSVEESKTLYNLLYKIIKK